MKEKFLKLKVFLKKIFEKKVYIPNRVYYIVLFVIPITGILLKNLLLQAYIMGDNLYAPNFSTEAQLRARILVSYLNRLRYES